MLNELPHGRLFRKNSFGKSSCLLTLVLIGCQLCSVRIAQAEPAPISGTGTYSQQYTAITKNILQNGIELERFSLNFRRENSKQAKYRKLRYFATQEAGAACGLAFEIIGDSSAKDGNIHFN